MAQPPEVRKAKAHFSRARRELRKAVERFSGIDPLEGHRVEAVRRAREVRDTADDAVVALGGESSR